MMSDDEIWQLEVELTALHLVQADVQEAIRRRPRAVTAAATRAVESYGWSVADATCGCPRSSTRVGVGGGTSDMIRPSALHRNWSSGRWLPTLVSAEGFAAQWLSTDRPCYA